MIEQTESQHKVSNTKSVNKTLAILSTFSETEPMQRTTHITEKLDMSMSTVSRHLNTMLDWGFLERDELTGYYFPGLKMISLAGAALQNNDVFRHSSPELQRISYKYGVHGHMGIPRDTDIVHMISSSCENTMDLHIPMGHCHPMYCSAMGRALLAHMPTAKVQEILKKSELKKINSETRIDPYEINKELIRTRQKGYCILLNELNEGKGSLAATVFDRNRIPVASISVSASAHSLEQPERERELAKAVMSAARKISGKLGYYPK